MFYFVKKTRKLYSSATRSSDGVGGGQFRRNITLHGRSFESVHTLRVRTEADTVSGINFRPVNHSVRPPSPDLSQPLPAGLQTTNSIDTLGSGPLQSPSPLPLPATGTLVDVFNSNVQDVVDDGCSTAGPPTRVQHDHCAEQLREISA